MNQHGGQHEAAARAAEAAYALDSTDQHLDILAAALVLFGRELNQPRVDASIDGGGRLDTDEADALRGLHAIPRALDLRVALWDRLLAQGVPPWQVHQFRAVGGIDGQVEVLLEILARRVGPPSPELAAAADEIRQRYVTRGH